MKFLFILNDPPYGTERVYNGLRLANDLLSKQEVNGAIELDVFLMGDSASAAKAGQATPNGYYNVERMLTTLLRKGGTIRVCATCLDARGLTQQELLDGAQRSTLDELTALTAAADKVLVF
ncbi:MAG: DsrE family protein [Demequinaceae bacterium]|nr:DsrE family protein [Demequinaceae bacterium]